MGLDIVEIVMTIEEEFDIELPASSLSPVVGDVQEFVVNAYDPPDLDMVMSLLPENDDSGSMPYDQYFTLWKTYSWLPGPKCLFLRKKYAREHVESELLKKMDYANNPDLIRERVAEIIRDELGMKVNPKAHDHLIDDLGAG